MNQQYYFNQITNLIEEAYRDFHISSDDYRELLVDVSNECIERVEEIDQNNMENRDEE